jgi:hypothetical protein
MKISKIIDELTELQKYIGDKELESCTANDTTAGVNVMYLNDKGGWTSTSLEGEKMANLIKETTSNQETLDENMETRDMNANRLKTEESKIQWLENEIKDLEYVLSSDCINRNNKLCRLQMFRELLAIKLGTARANAVKKIKENLSRDAVEFLKYFGGLTDVEKMSIKSLTCLQMRA